MKVLMINGSSNEHGCTYIALSEISNVLEAQNIEVEIIQIGSTQIRECYGCQACKKMDCQCAFNDDMVNEVIKKAKDADGFVFGSPVYFAHPTGRLLSFMDRLFYAGKKNFEYKPAAAIVSARRAGTTASLDVITKHFSISKMPIVSSSYWNMVHGNKPSEVRQDLEGLQVMRNIGHNMAWLMKCIEAGKQAGINPQPPEEQIRTNFIR